MGKVDLTEEGKGRMLRDAIARYGRRFVRHEITLSRRAQERESEDYRAGAAAALEHQLATCRSPARRAKLAVRLKALGRE